MTLITGPISYVTTNPETVTEAWIRAPHTRGHATGIITESNDRIPITGGHTSFTCAPGPAILVLAKVVETGRPAPVSVPETQVVPILAPDTPTATLREVVEAARLTELGSVNELEELAQSVARSAARAETAAADASAALAGKADLVNGQVPTSQIPAVALTKPQQVHDRVGMLALTDVQEGDVVVVSSGTDKGTYMLSGGPASQFSSWVKLTTPDAPVQSVNGQTGTVNLGPGDVGATTVGSSVMKAVSAAEARSAIGAGNSSLALGTTSTTAARGDHTHTELQKATPVIGTTTHANKLVKTDSSGHVASEGLPTAPGHLVSKEYVDGQLSSAVSDRVTGAGQTQTLWSGSQADYDALSASVRNGVGFVAVIY